MSTMTSRGRPATRVRPSRKEGIESWTHAVTANAGVGVKDKVVAFVESEAVILVVAFRVLDRDVITADIEAERFSERPGKERRKRSSEERTLYKY